MSTRLCLNHTISLCPLVTLLTLLSLLPSHSTNIAFQAGAPYPSPIQLATNVSNASLQGEPAHTAGARMFLDDLQRVLVKPAFLIPLLST